MKYTDIKNLTDEELVNKIAQESDSLSKLKFSNELTQIENPMQIRHTRKLIAKLKTEQSARAK